MDQIGRVRIFARAHGLLHEEHRAERAKYPARMTAVQTRAFKAWEKAHWWPRFQALDQRRHAAEAEAREVEGYAKPGDRNATDPLLTLRNEAKTDTRIEVDMEAVIRGN